MHVLLHTHTHLLFSSLPSHKHTHFSSLPIHTHSYTYIKTMSTLQNPQQSRTTIQWTMWWKSTPGAYPDPNKAHNQRRNTTEHAKSPLSHTHTKTMEATPNQHNKPPTMKAACSQRLTGRIRQHHSLFSVGMMQSVWLKLSNSLQQLLMRLFLSYVFSGG